MHKYHRTMDQAFPFGADYGCAVQAYKQSILSKISTCIGYAAVFGSLLLLAMAYFDVLVK
jgi:hypothetical protein